MTKGAKNRAYDFYHVISKDTMLELVEEEEEEEEEDEEEEEEEEEEEKEEDESLYYHYINIFLQMYQMEEYSD